MGCYWYFFYSVFGTAYVAVMKEYNLPMMMFYATTLQQQRQDALLTTVPMQDEPPLGQWPVSFEGAFTPVTLASLTQWQVHITGQVETPLQYSYPQLKLLPQSFQVRRIVSQYGWSYRSEWSGVAFKELFARSNPKATAKFVQLTNAAGDVRFFALEDCLKSEALLVLHEGAVPLSAWHGGPVRWISFHRWFEAGLAQLTEITLLSKLPAGVQWEQIDTDTLVQPCKIYCYDLKQQKNIDKPGEVKMF